MSNPKPPIVIAAYGTGDPEAQRHLESLDERLHERFAGHEIRWAITAGWLIKRFRNAGKTTLFARREPLQNLAELYRELRTQGKTKAVVQSLLVHEGSESRYVYDTPTEGLKVEYGPPLLQDEQNIKRLINAVAGYFGANRDLTILIGHGSDTEEISNVPFKRIDEYLRNNYRDTYVTMIHGAPSPDDVFPLIDRGRFDRVVFVPLLITSGEHIQHDVLADKPESWISRLGLPYHLAPSLSETPAVMNIYHDSIQRALEKLKS